MILFLSGYDERLLTSQEPIALRWLTLSSAWVLASIFFCSASAAALIYATGGSLTMLVAVSIVTLFFLLALQAYAQTSTATTTVDRGPAPVYQRGLRLGFASLLSIIFLIFTQPLLMLLAGSTGVGQVSTSVIRTQMDLMRLKQHADGIRRDLSMITELQRRLSLPGLAPTLLSNETQAQVLSKNAASANRRALIIGNDQYRFLSTLDGAVNDVRDLEKVLRQLGFTVQVVLNGDRKAMELAVERYAESLQPGDISLFHYSGHGFQSRGGNYLAPVEYFADRNSTPPNATAVNLIIEAFSRRKPLASVILIDACRENISGSSKEGLAAIEAGANTYIALAARPGQLAGEIKGTGGKVNGLFTAAILRHLSKPVDVDEMLRAVRSDVAAESKKLSPLEDPQETWSSHNLNATLVLGSESQISNTGAVKLKPSDATPTTSLLEPLTLTSGEIVCNMASPGQRAPDGILLSRYGRCLQARSYQLRDDLIALDRSSASPSSNSGDGNVSLVGVEGSLLGFRAFWGRSPILAISSTSALMLLFCGGVWWRTFMHGIHLAYDEKLHQIHRAITKEKATAVMAQAKTWQHAPGEAHLQRRFMDRFGVTSVVATASTLDELQHFIESLEIVPPTPQALG